MNTFIGEHYSRENYNCAGFVAKWYKEKLNIEIPIVNEFGLSFMLWMKRNFVQVDKPVENCLIRMTTPTGENHIGVWHDHGVIHNFKHVGRHGAVCKWKLLSVKVYYREVSYWVWSE